jgi:hypothetical protein
MKKVIFIACLSLVVLASCKKDYTCTVVGVDVQYVGLDKDEAKAVETSCKSVGGTWTTN